MRRRRSGRKDENNEERKVQKDPEGTHLNRAAHLNSRALADKNRPIKKGGGPFGLTPLVFGGAEGDRTSNPETIRRAGGILITF